MTVLHDDRTKQETMKPQVSGEAVEWFNFATPIEPCGWSCDYESFDGPIGVTLRWRWVIGAEFADGFACIGDEEPEFARIKPKLEFAGIEVRSLCTCIGIFLSCIQGFRFQISNGIRMDDWDITHVCSDIVAYIVLMTWWDPSKMTPFWTISSKFAKSRPKVVELNQN